MRTPIPQRTARVFRFGASLLRCARPGCRRAILASAARRDDRAGTRGTSRRRWGSQDAGGPLAADRDRAAVAATAAPAVPAAYAATTAPAPHSAGSAEQTGHYRPAHRGSIPPHSLG